MAKLQHVRAVGSGEVYRFVILPPVVALRIERFNGRLRDECLQLHWFLSLENARRTIERWRIAYNTNGPHSGLREQTPAEFAKMNQKNNLTELSASRGEALATYNRRAPVFSTSSALYLCSAPQAGAMLPVPVSGAQRIVSARH